MSTPKSGLELSFHEVVCKTWWEKVKSISISKYLGVLLDEHLQWNDQIAQVKIKLNHAIGILSKIRHNANPTI